MATHPAIAAALAAPATHEVVVSYSDGSEETFALRNEAVAERRADFFLNRMSRPTQPALFITGVDVREIAA